VYFPCEAALVDSAVPHGPIGGESGGLTQNTALQKNRTICLIGIGARNDGGVVCVQYDSLTLQFAGFRSMLRGFVLRGFVFC
jgi:hypothetical protein